MRLIDIESEAFLSEMRQKQNAVKELITESDAEKKEWTARDHWESVYGSFVEIALTLRAQPTVDAVPVIHGRWELVDEAEPRRYGCSKCSCLSWYGTYKYCPNCGAKMDMEE